MRRFRYLLLLLVLLPGMPPLLAQAVKDLPRPTDYVSDNAHALSGATVDHLDRLCAALDQQAHAQMAVVTVNNTAGEPIADYAVQLEDAWKVGAKGTDRGVILLVDTGDRKWFISTGYGLEGVVTDERAGIIGRQMSQYLRVSRKDEGVTLGADELASLIAKDEGVQLNVRSMRLAPPNGGAHVGLGQLAVLAAVFMLLFILASRTGMLPFLLGMFLGGGFGGGGGRGDGGNDDGGDGFSGFGGGSTGGGGAGGSY